MDASDKAIAEVRAVREHDEEIEAEKDVNRSVGGICGITNSLAWKLTQPVGLTWNPQPDITAYELAQLLPLLLGHRMIMPHDLPKDEKLLRHLIVDDPNK